MAEESAPILAAKAWQASYRHEDGDLVELFYVPALECAVAYDRMTGYFTAEALALAARGLERLIANGGQMRLIVGCTLDEDEVEAIGQGYSLRHVVESSLVRVTLTAPDLRAGDALASLAWMVAQGRLDVKVAVPINPDGKPTAAPGLYHEKVGILTDAAGDRLSFSGSINETRGGWINNRESFHVHCSWEGGREARHVADEVAAFERLWSNGAKSVEVLDFPEAARAKLLGFLPKDDRFVAPSPTPTQEGERFRLSTASATPAPRLDWSRPSSGPMEIEETPEPIAPEPAPAHRLMPEEFRRVVWAYIAESARLENGVRVGEVTSAVRPWPHQIRTFARAYQNWPCRLLIADEVGLGKTISAGLLMRQAWLSGRAGRILLMVPAGVLPQWQAELYEKFNLNVPAYDGQKLSWRRTHGWTGPHERKVGREEWHKENFVLCSSHLMRRSDRAEELLRAEDWDLVVLDEAHHARRKSPGSPREGGPNRLLRLMQAMKDKARSLVLLTATPMQVHPVEVWDLLNLLGLPPRWSANREDFSRYFRLASGNPSESEMKFLAEMFQAVESGFGPTKEEEVGRLAPAVKAVIVSKVLRALRDRSGIPLKRLDVAERGLALRVLRRHSPIHHLMSRHTRALLRIYHERGELDASIPTREVRDVPIPLTEAERELYDAVEDYIGTTYNNAANEERSAIGFVMTIYRRRLASSFHALRQTLNKRLAGEGLAIAEEDVSQDEQGDEVMDADEAVENARRALVAEERSSIQGLLKRIAKLGTDSKLVRLKVEIEAAFADGYDSAIIFTQFTDTLDRVKVHLAQEFPDLEIATYSGRGAEARVVGDSWVERSKERIKRDLKAGSIRLLICSDAAAEGLNLQTCGVLINLDLPWNPMRVEQRIGRIDRIGQKHAKIRVVNFAYEDTVEADVYFALRRRINLFQGVVGKLQPILSRLPAEFERISLERPERRGDARERLRAEVEIAAEAVESDAFDIDDTAGDALDLPVLPPPALTLDDLDAALNRPEVRPPSVEWGRLDVGSYSLRMPGMAESARVTTRAEVFDDHFQSHEFLSPGGSLFANLQTQAPSSPSPSKVMGVEGICWLLAPEDGRLGHRFVVQTRSGQVAINSLAELIDSLGKLGTPQAFDNSIWPNYRPQGIA